MTVNLKLDELDWLLQVELCEMMRLPIDENVSDITHGAVVEDIAWGGRRA